MNGEYVMLYTFLAHPKMSISVRTEACAVPCSMKITSLLYAGNARLNPDGKMTRLKSVNLLMPNAMPASISPFGVCLIAPLKISMV